MSSTSKSDINEQILSTLDQLKSMLSDLYDEVNTLKKEIRESIKSVRDEIRREVGTLRREIDEKVSRLDKRIDDVEKRLKEAEENLEKHLEKQDHVLEVHSEALMNGLALQTLLNVVHKYDKTTSFTLSHIGKNPLIVVEDHESIVMLVITEVLSNEVQDTLNRLAERLRIFTDKEVRYKVLTIRASAKETIADIEPIWSFMLE